uniref:RING-type domain-containing protein n=1 Tax=Babesia bovis TaxID=5865 RepID=S6B9W9_BABBO|nr:conserved hypothetical protein [Babesia bovis]
MDVNEESFYFCHICSSGRAPTEVMLCPNGDFLCLVCSQEGFVEKIAAPRSPAFPNMHIAFGGPHHMHSMGQAHVLPPMEGMSDPFSSALGMPLQNFIEGVFRNAVPQSQHHNTFTFRSNVIGAPNIRVTRYNMGPPHAGDMPFAQAPNNENSTVNDEAIPQQLFRAFMQNPFDLRAINQFLTYVMENDPNREGPPPTAQRILENLETETLDEEHAKELGTCAICTEDFAAGDRINWISKDRKLCGHGFHVDCIVPWLKQHNSCPVCRYELPTDDEDYNRQREELRSRLVEEVQRHVESAPPPETVNTSAPENPVETEQAPRNEQPQEPQRRGTHPSINL